MCVKKALSVRIYFLFAVLNFISVPVSDECLSDDGRRSGVCLNTYECKIQQGVSHGHCALGFGVCCVCECLMTSMQKRQWGLNAVHRANKSQQLMTRLLCLFTVTILWQLYVCQFQFLRPAGHKPLTTLPTLWALIFQACRTTLQAASSQSKRFPLKSVK